MQGRPRPPLGGLTRILTDRECHALDSSATQGQPVEAPTSTDIVT